MHTLNNLLGGPYVNKEQCRRAARRVVHALSEAGAGDLESADDHLHLVTGWLSIDVLNVIGLGTLGPHVVESAGALDAVRCNTAVSVWLVNWNNQHWSALRKNEDVWEHLNSILGDEIYKGRRDFDDRAVRELLEAIRESYGAATLHRVEVADVAAGYVLLEREGVRAMVGRADDEHEPHESLARPSEHSAATVHPRIVSLNVDGCGNYRTSVEDRMRALLDAVLVVDPNLILLQEVTQEMYTVLKRRLSEWCVYGRRAVSEDYFVVTAVREKAATEEDKCSSYPFPDSNDGRHVLVVARPLGRSKRPR